MTGAATSLEEAGGSEEAADESLFRCGDEHAASPTAAAAVAALSATNSGRCIQSVGRLGGSGRFAKEGCR
ncbi:hypothetical protein MTY59_39630 [Mycobacterium senriense]|uniref:Uncharacterized protein n=1 Tax=Mycobacterium senriense TaxID=2775496 RepID=A0ABM7SUY4_9MYCO|nr:hypothetical protein MTY59_39630 [Mycobacterium senriense]